jgi:3'-phosphoadenosine 5'-phosphosulfate sulfotransferase (PAPS reductase)/FAD synthetase
MNRKVVWFSCGAASTMVAKIIKDSGVDAEYVYCDTGGEHTDNRRFLSDVEKWLGIKVQILKNEKYANHIDVIRKTKYVNGVRGAMCTTKLKKQLRFKYQQADDAQYFGYTVEEKHRAERFNKSFPEVDAKFPLIEQGITKKECLGVLWNVGIELPTMYKLGYNNNNCIGCVKGGKGYWNQIRKDFPDAFNEMAVVEREVGASCINGTFLDELKKSEGRHEKIEISCDFVCQDLSK